jgi:hypothetical protein
MREEDEQGVPSRRSKKGKKGKKKKSGGSHAMILGLEEALCGAEITGRLETAMEDEGAAVEDARA